MLHDLPQGRLENEYRPVPPQPGDAVLCFRGPDVLLRRHEDDRLELPAADSFSPDGLRYAFRLLGRSYYLRTAETPDALATFAWERVRTLRQTVSREVCYAIMTGWHLHNWYQNNRLCGRCGTQTVHGEAERHLRCPNCGNLTFPRINPVVIAAVTDGDRLLLSRYARREYTHYALLAGYTEIGETMEQSVAREVFEEVGLRVKNIRYYKSQPWGIDGNILMGFFCDLDGDDTISIDETELSHAAWYPRHDLPIQDDGFSLPREMIRIFSEGKEPR